MTMLDILMNRLPDGLTITGVKEKPSKYIVRFAYKGEDLSGQVELVKACSPGSENSVCDTTIQTAMTAFMINKGNIEEAQKWMGYAKKVAATKSIGARTDSKEAILKIIRSHNAVVTAIEESGLTVPEGKLFTAMGIWHKLACEGADITHMVRGQGIDAKCDMQTGRIFIEGDLEHEET